MTRQPRFPRLLPLAAAVCLVVAACAGGDSEDADQPPSTVIEGSVPPTTEPPGTTLPGENIPIDATIFTDTLGDPVQYGGVSFTVRSAELTNEPPSSKFDDLGLGSDIQFVYVDVAVDNDMTVGSLDVDIDDMFHLDIGGAAPLASLEIDTTLPSPTTVTPGASGTYLVAFETVLDVDPTTMVFSIGERDRHQIDIPFDGSEPQNDPWPVVSEATGTGTVEGAFTCRRNFMQATADQVRFDVDIVHDQPATGAFNRRASAGTVFLEAAVTFFGTDIAPVDDDDCGISRVESAMVSLTIESRLQEDIYLIGSSNFVPIANGESVPMNVGFQIPADAQDVELILGNKFGQKITLPIDIPPEIAQLAQS